MSKWDSYDDCECPVMCPNCWDDGIESELYYAPDTVMPKLFLEIHVFGTCYNCGNSVLCVYSFRDDVEESEVFTQTEH